MKKIIIVFAASLFAFGCTDYKSQVASLQKEKQELISNTNYKDSTISDFMASFNEIEQSMNELSQKQKLITTGNSAELKNSPKDRMIANIHEIDKLLQENKTKIASLSRKLKNSNFKFAELEKMVASLNEQIVAKDAELASLNEKVASLNTTVATLNTQVDTLNKVTAAKAKTIDEQTVKIQTAYFTKGTYKELKTKSVVAKDGGFLGLGKSEMLKKDFDRSAFTSINIMQVTDIPIAAKDVELLTNHPSDSYTLKKNDKDVVSDLVITDPEKFWSNSKYLVVVTDK
ncbi:MAG: hypothetical protein ABI723_03060 [Bacteroidia bacterium]